MSIQSKILFLLVGIVATLGAGLAVLKYTERTRFQAIAAERTLERQRTFGEFIEERGDRLKVLSEDSTNWDELVLALLKRDTTWTAQQFNEQTLPSYQANAVWIYHPDGSLFYSCNNRYAENLKEFPLPAEELKRLFAGERVRHFFVKVPQGWMEIRGGTIHPSRDRYRETKPAGWFLVGQFWIDDNIRRMSLFTGYSIRITDLAGAAAPPLSAEELGLISFSQDLPGWDGNSVARVEVRNDSPIIRKLNQASRRLFLCLMVFAALVFIVLALSLGYWIRRPLQVISRELTKANPAGLATLEKEPNEFGKLAGLILRSRRTEEALHKTEEQLRHAQKLEAVGRLAGGVAHDFNNLLTAIIGYSELLETSAELDENSRESIGLIRKAGEQAAALTRQLLAFSRKQLLQPKVLDLNQLLREMEKLLQRVIGEHIRIVHKTEAAESRVRADPDQLQQVILNLGINARDAMPRGGTLTISTVNLVPAADFAHGSAEPSLAGKNCIALSVKDTGSGMDQPTRERIFEPFFTTKGPGKGTGLGLATVYGIITQSGGAIRVESDPGKGSTFTLFLPCVDAPVDVVPPAPARLEATTNAETLLVVEDEEIVRQLICAVLRELGYNVLCSSSPSEAVKLVQEHAGGIDLLITDVVLPEMHGPQLARILTGLKPKIKVLYVSGYSENDISDQGVVEPGLEVLQKPFTQQSLARKIHSMLHEHATTAPASPQGGETRSDTPGSGVQF